VKIRPGPPALEPGRCPGGVVVQVYATTIPPTLLIEQRISLGDDVERAATDAAALADELEADVCLVAFDGDTGERIPTW